jgi:hypothetical protein
LQELCDLLRVVVVVQECDARMLYSSTMAGPIELKKWVLILLFRRYSN